MKKLTARNSTFLHNAKLMFGAPAYKRILAAAQHSEGQAWNVAREYISLDGSEATRKVMFSERYADLDTMFRAIKAEFSAEPAAIAANVSADAAPAWTPKPGMLVRFKQGIQLSGDNRDVDAIQGMGVVGKIIRRCSEVGYEWTVSFGLDGDYNAATDELEPASAPAPDAAQTAAVRERLAAIVSPYLPDTAEELYEPDGAVRSIKRDDGTLIDGTWIGGSLYIDAMQVGMEKREQDAQIAALTRDLEAARTEAAALQEALAEILEPYNRYKDETRYLRDTEMHDNYVDRDRARKAQHKASQDLYAACDAARSTLEAQTDAALAAARQRADSGARHSVADVEAALEAQWKDEEA